jgi:hypothetical protein
LATVEEGSDSTAVAPPRYATPVEPTTTIGAEVADGRLLGTGDGIRGNGEGDAAGIAVGLADCSVDGEELDGNWVCVGNNNAGTVLAVGDEADGSALGTLLALKEGKAVGKSPGPAVRNVEGSSDGPELEGDMERSAGSEDGLKLGPKVGKGDGALVIG